MARIERFEDIEAWQLARELTHEIYLISNKGEFRKDFGLRDQIRRSSVSIMANIAEGYERHSRQEFIRFLDIAKASAGEVRSHLYVALDAGYLAADEFNELYSNSLRIIRMIAAFGTYLRKDTMSTHEPIVAYDNPSHSNLEFAIAEGI